MVTYVFQNMDLISVSVRVCWYVSYLNRCTIEFQAFTQIKYALILE